MSSNPYSPVSSTGVCLRVLRRLLEEESAVRSQLSYVIQNIHNPILESCDPAYLKLLPQVTIPSSIGNAGTKENSDGSAPPSPTRVLSPLSFEPNGPTASATATATASATATAVSVKKGKKNISPATAANKLAKRQTNGVLTFAEYWELFSNLATLYSTQCGVVDELEKAVKALTALLARLRRESDRTEDVSVDTRADDDDDDAVATASGSKPSKSTHIGVPDVMANADHADAGNGSHKSSRSSSPHSPHGESEAAPSGGDAKVPSTEHVLRAPPPSDALGGSISLCSPGPLGVAGSSVDESSAPQSGASPTTHLTHQSEAPPIPPAYRRGTPQQRKSSLDEEAYTALGNIVVGFFTSATMSRVVAEHMMYSVNYTSKAAPKVLEMSRIWRRCSTMGGGGGGGGGGGAGGVSSGPGAGGGAGASALGPLAGLAPKERDLMLRYGGLLEFLLRTFGASGTPPDSRIRITTLPEASPSTQVSGGTGNVRTLALQAPSTPCVTVSPVTVAAAAAATSGGVAGGAAAAAMLMGTGKRHHAESAGAAAAAAVAAAARQFPRLPSAWKGFHTFIVLLATPLPCLRRYLHVARCLIASAALQSRALEELQNSFISAADSRLTEESVLALEELAQHDVRTIMSLIDNSSSAVVVGLDGATTAGGGSALAQFRSSQGVRVLVHYGRLYKRSGRGKHERLVFLFSDWLCYVEELSSGRMRLRGAMPLETLRVVEVPDSLALDVVNCFELIVSQTKRFAFFAPTPEQKRQWIDAIRFAVRHHNRSGLRAKLAVANGSNSTAAAAAAASASLFDAMKPSPSTPTLRRTSRLVRQRRYDHALQDYLDAQAALGTSVRMLSPQASMFSASGVGRTASITVGLHTANVNVSTPAAAADTSGVDGATTAQQQQQQQQSAAANGAGGGGSATAPLASFHSRSSSMGMPRISSAHRQLEYDVTPWTRQSTAHRRYRGGQEQLLLSSPAVAALGSHSRMSSFASSASSQALEADGAAPDEHAAHTDSSHGEGDGAGVAEDESRPFVPLRSGSVGASATGNSNGSDATGLPHRLSVNSAFLPPAINASFATRAESIGGASSSSRPPIPSTPLRRPVSEWFESAQSTASTPSPRPRRALSTAMVTSSAPASAMANAKTASSASKLPLSAAPPRVPTAASAVSLKRTGASSPAEIGDAAKEPLAGGSATAPVDAPHGEEAPAALEVDSFVLDDAHEEAEDEDDGQAATLPESSGSSSGAEDDFVMPAVVPSGDGVAATSTMGNVSASTTATTTAPSASTQTRHVPDEEESTTVAVALTAFRPRRQTSEPDAALTADGGSPLASEVTHGSPPPPAATATEGGAREGAQAAATAAAADEHCSPTRPHARQIYVDPSRDLDAIFQQEETEGEADSPHEVSTSGGNPLGKSEENRSQIQDQTADSSLDLSENDIRHHEAQQEKNQEEST